MAGIEHNAEKAAVTSSTEQPTFSKAQTEGYSSSNFMKVADETMQRGILPILVICPDGTVAGKATTKQDLVKLNLSCGDKG